MKADIAFQRRPPLAPLPDENETYREDEDAEIKHDEMVEQLNEKLSERLSKLSAQTVEG